MKSCPSAPVSEARKCRLSLLSADPQRSFDNQFWAANRYMNEWRARHYTIPPATPLKTRIAGIDMSRLVPYRQKAWSQARAGVFGDMPVLILYGKQDTLDWAASSPTAQLRGGLALFDIVGAKDPNVEMIVINHAGHFVFRDEPGEFESDLTHFIDYWDRHPAR